MNSETGINAQKQPQEGTPKSYTWGFALSLVLTLAAYFAVTQGLFTGLGLEIWLIALAIAQAGIQLFLFLHLGAESKPRWKALVFSFMLLVITILVLGTIWIMHNLEYNMMEA